jgi:hypothetical protein
MPTRSEVGEMIKKANAAGDVESTRKLIGLYWKLPDDGVPTKPMPQVDTTPSNVIPQVLVGKGGEKRLLNKDVVEYGKQGVDKDVPGDGALDWEDYANIAQYSAGPEYSAKYVGRKVKERLGPSSPYDPEDLVRVVDGKVQYLDISKPAARWKWVDTSMFDSLASPTTAAKFGGEIATDVVGGVGAGLLGSMASPAVGIGAGAAAAGANSAAWRYANLKRGVELGINEGLSDEDIKAMATGRGLQTTGFAFGAGIPGAWKVAGNKVDAGLFDKNSANYADDVKKGLDESASTIDDINRIHTEAGPTQEQFNPSVAKRSGVKDVQDIEADLKAGHASRATANISGEIKARENADRRVLKDVWDWLMPYDPLSAANRRSAGQGILAGAQDVYAGNPVVQAQMQAMRKTGLLKQEVAKIDDTITPAQVLEAVRGTPSPGKGLQGTKLYELQDRLRQQQLALDEEVRRRSMRPNGKQVTVEFNTKNLLLQDLLKLRARASAGSGMVPPNESAGMVDRLIERLQKQGGSLTWNQFDADYQRIGRMIENRTKGKIQSTDQTISVGELEELRAIYDRALKMKDNTGPNGLADLISAWKQRKDITTLKHDYFDGKVMRGVMASADPEKHLPEAFVNDLFPTEGAAYLRILYDNVKGDPEAVSGLRSFILRQYKKEVIGSNGRPSLDAHNRWMANHKEQLDVLFDGNPPPGLARIGALEEGIQAANAQGAAKAKLIRKQWYSVLNQKYVEGGAGVQDIFDNVANLRGSVQQIEQMAQFIGKTSPESLELLQRQAINNHKLQLQASKELPTSARLIKWLESDKGQRFTALMSAGGRQTYEQDLRSLAGALKMMESTGTAKPAPTQGIVTELWRIGAGPLSRMNRFMTGVRRFSTWADAGRAYEVISDPDRLHRALTYGTGGASQKVDEMIPSVVMMDIGALGAFFVGNSND